jgi:enolase
MLTAMGVHHISEIKAREILDSLGRPMVEVDVLTSGGEIGRAGASCGTSVGSNEAFVLRDRDIRYQGLGVQKAVENVNTIISQRLVGMDVTNQRDIDNALIELDGTPNKSKLGANAILSVSLAVADAASRSLRLPLYRFLGGIDPIVLPVPMFNIVNGGPFSATDLDFQESLIMPIGAESFSEALRMAVEVYLELGRVLKRRFGKKGLNRGHAAGYAPPLNDPRDVFDIMQEAINQLGYGEQFKLCLDCAAAHIFDSKAHRYRFMGREVDREQMILFYERLVDTYPVFSIEDPLDEEDFEGHAELTKRLGIQILGDDLFTTNLARLQKGIECGAANGIILKPNQIGTLSETIDVARYAQKSGYEVVPASRAGKPEDPIVDIAVAIGAFQCKFGAPSSGERNEKYNRLLRIEEELGPQARFVGKGLLRHTA